MYTSQSIYIYVYTHVLNESAYAHIYIIHERMRICTCVYIYIYMFMHCCAAVLQLLRASARVEKKHSIHSNVPHKVHMHTRTYIYIYMCVCMYANVYVYIYIYVCIYMYVCCMYIVYHNLPAKLSQAYMQPAVPAFWLMLAANEAKSWGNMDEEHGDPPSRRRIYTWFSEQTLGFSYVYIYSVFSSICIYSCIFTYIWVIWR